MRRYAKARNAGTTGAGAVVGSAWRVSNAPKESVRKKAAANPCARTANTSWSAVPTDAVVHVESASRTKSAP